MVTKVLLVRDTMSIITAKIKKRFLFCQHEYCISYFSVSMIKYPDKKQMWGISGLLWLMVVKGWCPPSYQGRHSKRQNGGKSRMPDHIFICIQEAGRWNGKCDEATSSQSPFPVMYFIFQRVHNIPKQHHYLGPSFQIHEPMWRYFSFKALQMY